MNKFLILSVVIAVAAADWTPRPDSRCPPGSPNPPVFLPDEADCTRFFSCVNGIAFPIPCPENQHWSIRDNRCEWPERAQCRPSSPQECPPTNDGPPVHLPHPTDCTRFFICNWGNPLERQCPEGQHWSVAHGWCDWPDRANCNLGGGSEEDTGRNTTTTRRTSSTRHRH